MFQDPLAFLSCGSGAHGWDCWPLVRLLPPPSFTQQIWRVDRAFCVTGPSASAYLQQSPALQPSPIARRGSFLHAGMYVPNWMFSIELDRAGSLAGIHNVGLACRSERSKLISNLLDDGQRWSHLSGRYQEEDVTQHVLRNPPETDVDSTQLAACSAPCPGLRYRHRGCSARPKSSSDFGGIGHVHRFEGKMHCFAHARTIRRTIAIDPSRRIEYCFNGEQSKLGRFGDKLSA